MPVRDMTGAGLKEDNTANRAAWMNTGDLRQTRDEEHHPFNAST